MSTTMSAGDYQVGTLTNGERGIHHNLRSVSARHSGNGVRIGMQPTVGTEQVGWMTRYGALALAMGILNSLPVGDLIGSDEFCRLAKMILAGKNK